MAASNSSPGEVSTAIMSPKTRDTEARREAILQAAHELFADLGLRHTRLEDVARRARVSKGSLYELAPNKLELFYLICSRRLDIEFERMEAAIAAADNPLDKLRAALNGILPTHRELPGVYAILFELHTAALRENSLNGRVAELFRENFTRLRRPVIALIEEGIKTGLLRADLQPHDAATTMEAWAFLKWFQWITFPEMTVADLKTSSSQWIDNVLSMLAPPQKQ